MGIFDFAGSNNVDDSGGAGAPPLLPPASLPSVSAPRAPVSSPLPTPPAFPSAPADSGVDPRLQAVLSRLQPPAPESPLKMALKKILPIIGAAIAMHQNAGGAFAQEWQNVDKSRRDDQNAQVRQDLELATILHQQQQERLNAQATTARERTAQMRMDAQAAKEQRDKLVAEERTRFADVLQGPIVEQANELAKTGGKKAVDDFLSKFTGVGGKSLKDLSDQYGLRDQTTGEIATGKAKNQKEIAAGSQEEYVLRARKQLEAQLGRPLADAEISKSDEKALTRYKTLGKDEDQMSMLRGLQIDTAQLHKELMQQQIDRGLSEKYGSSPIWMQDGDGNPHIYFVKKGEAGQTPTLLEVKPSGMPPDISRLQPPNQFSKWLKSVFGDKKPTIKQVGGDGTDLITDPNWGK